MYKNRGHYAQVKCRGKQIRRSLGTNDLALARRVLANFKRDLELTDPTLARRTLETHEGRFLKKLSGAESTLYCVARYDCAHGTPHQDILGIKGGTLAKQWFFDSSRKEAFQNAISDFKANAEEHIRFFREN